MALTTRPSQLWLGSHRGGGRRNDGAAAAPHPFEVGKRHQQRPRPGKADHLARDGALRRGLDQDAGADRHGVEGAGDLDQEAAHRRDAAIDLDRAQLADLFGQRLDHCRYATGKRGAVFGYPSTNCLPASLIIRWVGMERIVGRCRGPRQSEDRATLRSPVREHIGAKHAIDGKNLNAIRYEPIEHLPARIRVC